MSSFGENLRREREMRGVSLEEICAATKVSVRFLHDLENNDFSDIPGGIFTRGFIRAYAGYLGLDVEQVMAEYEAEAQPQDYELNRLVSANRRRQQRNPIRILPSVIAVVLLASGYALFRYAHRAADTPAPLPAATSLTTSPATTIPAATNPAAPALPSSSIQSAQQASGAPSNIPSSGASSATPNDTANPSSSNTPVADSPTGAVSAPAKAASGTAAPATPQAGPRDDLVLQVAATERVWVSVETDGKNSWQRTLNPNDVATLKAKDYFDLTTGNAQGLVLTLNGETLKPLGRQGEVKKIHLTRDELRSPNP